MELVRWVRFELTRLSTFPPQGSAATFTPPAHKNGLSCRIRTCDHILLPKQVPWTELGERQLKIGALGGSRTHTSFDNRF